METMTSPSIPTIAPTPPPAPPAKKKIGKGWYVLGALMVFGIIGGVNNAREDAKFKADVDTTVNRSIAGNLTSDGSLNEIGFVKDNCAASLDMDLPNTSQTFRQALANGSVTIGELAESYARGYYDKAAAPTMSRSAVLNACTQGLRNG